MRKFYSPTTRGFYAEEVHGAAIPADAREIAAELYEELLARQAAGSVIQPAADGTPIAVSPPLGTASLSYLSPSVLMRRLEALVYDTGDPQSPQRSRADDVAELLTPRQLLKIATLEYGISPDDAETRALLADAGLSPQEIDLVLELPA